MTVAVLAGTIAHELASIESDFDVGIGLDATAIPARSRSSPPSFNHVRARIDDATLAIALAHDDAPDREVS